MRGVRALCLGPILAALSLSLLCACGSSGGDASDGTTVGAGGGTVALPGGGTLVIPAGALTQDVAIVVAAIDAPASDAFEALGPFHSFGPDGLTFAVPALLTLPIAAPSGGAPDAGSAGLAWRVTGGDWTALPSAVGADGATLVAEIAHFSEGGPVAWTERAGACCLPGAASCEMKTAAECAGTWIGASVPCAPGGVDACGGLVCCTQTDGLSVLKLRVACEDGGGAVVGDEQCDTACCDVGGADEFVALGGAACQAQGGTPVAVDLCEDVCCLRHGEEQLTVRSGGACGLAGGEALALSECDTVCCLSGEGDFGEVIDYATCAGRDDASMPRDLCETVCCDLHGDAGFRSMSGAACLFEGEAAADPMMCEDVCCLRRSEQQLTVQSGSACADAGGEAQALSACDTVCCLSGADDFGELTDYATCDGRDAAPMPQELCGTVCCDLYGDEGYRSMSGAACLFAGQADADAAKCEEVCCELAFGEVRRESAGACADHAGAVRDAGVCGAVCCEGTDSQEATDYDTCVARGDRPSVAGNCEDVCCLRQNEQQLILQSGRACAEAGGDPLALSECDTVCCLPSEGDFGELTDYASCDGGGGAPMPSGQCATVCCDLHGDDGYRSMSAGACLYAGQPAADAAQCEAVCCELAFGEVRRASAGDCAGLSGVARDVSVCAAVCCEATESSEATDYDTCVARGDRPAVAGNCEDVCCLRQNEQQLILQSGRACAEAGGEPLALAECDEVCCLPGEGDFGELTDYASCDGGGGAPMPSAQCATVCCDLHGDDGFRSMSAGACLYAGALAEDAAQCEAVCCELDFGEVRRASAGDCAGLSGAARDVSVCESVCCEATDSQEAADYDTCVARGDRPSVAGNCEDVCCLRQNEQQLVLQSGRACAEAGGEPLALAECDEVCCLPGEGDFGELTDYAACDEGGGAPMPSAQCDEVCCELHDNEGYRSMSAGACLYAGQVDPENLMCGDVCCLREAEQQLTIQSGTDCGAAGGVAQAVSLCDTVCCLGSESDFGAITDYATCDGRGDAPMPQNLCDSVCCVLTDGGQHRPMSAAACLFEGTAAGDPAACDAVCCLVGDATSLLPAGDCTAVEGQTVADDQCGAVCCLVGDTHAGLDAAACAAQGGTIVADEGQCPADDCGGSAGVWAQAEGSVSGDPGLFTDAAGQATDACSDAYTTDPDKDAGADAVARVRVPQGACAVAKAEARAYNPSLAIVSDCGAEARACYAYNYGSQQREAVYPHVYPYPRPGEVRKTAVSACPAPDADTDVAIWIDTGTEQAEGSGGSKSLPLGDGDFRLDWRILDGPPANDAAAGATVIGPGAPARVESPRFATDTWSASECPGLDDGAGAGTPELFYEFVADTDGAVVFAVHILNPDINTVDDGTHFVALLDDTGDCFQARQSGVELLMKAEVDAGRTYTLVVDTGDRAENVLFEVLAEPYAGPSNDECATARVIEGLPFTDAGTTAGAFDHFTQDGENCGDLTGWYGIGRTSPDVVYRYTPATDEVVTVSLTSETPEFGASLAITTGCDDGTGLVTCTDGMMSGGGPITVRLTGGQAYTLVVDGGTEYAPVKEGDFVLSLAPGTIDVPDACASAIEIPSLPFEYRMNARNLGDDFSGAGSACDEYVCCRREEIYSISTRCDGVVADWAMCETTCCRQGELFSEELYGNCLHYGGTTDCGGSPLGVQCCQMLVAPQVAYVYAEGCGNPLGGGVQGDPVDPMYCEQVCCEGQGYQKRGNCENFESTSLPWPPNPNACGDSEAEVGAGLLDAVFRYTATEDGLLVAWTSSSSLTQKQFYGFRGDCADGYRAACDLSLLTTTRVQIPLRAGETGNVVVDGWDPERPFLSNRLTFEWIPGLPSNLDCDTALDIPALPFHDANGLADAGNDMMVVDGDFCWSVTHVTNGYDVVYRYDPAGTPTDLVVGVTRADFRPILYVLDDCPDLLPAWQECLASKATTGYVKPMVRLEGRTDPVWIVVDSPVGTKGGTFDLYVEAAAATPPPGDTCDAPIVVDTLPFTYTGSSVGASGDYFAPTGSCRQYNYSDYGAGPEVVFRLDITQEIIDAYGRIEFELLGTTVATQIWSMKNGCAADGSTCDMATGSSMTLNEGNHYQLGDTWYFVFDTWNAGDEGLFTVEVRGE